jgi:1,4-dihydroxy-6-naphthoate synthase
MIELSLGISPCPNDVFIFSGLILEKVRIPDVWLRISYFDIETLNERAIANELDIVKISYANYQRCENNYELLPTGGALGRGVGPLLLSHGQEWRADEEVLVPGQYTTANFLLDFWAQGQLKKQFKSFTDVYADLCNKPTAQGVVIHEKRFTYVQDGLTLIQDLGAYWEEKTGYPIPLGCVLARRGLKTDGIIDAIQQSLRWAYEHEELALSLCQQYASDLTPAVMRSHIDLYVNEYSNALGTLGEEAVSFFLNRVRKSVAV